MSPKKLNMDIKVCGLMIIYEFMKVGGIVNLKFFNFE